MFDVLFIVEILNELKTYLTQLNNRQRHYIASRASSKNEIVVVTLSKSFDIDIAATTKTPATSETFSEIFARSREDISILDSSAPRSNHILKSQDSLNKRLATIATRSIILLAIVLISRKESKELLA